ncbi:serine-arginine protein 55-like isoform X2 [Sitophilus oryzae]|uniref:Serine-arginine protein 55-like isoform X2 n=1 Tax=Sitophilus oryzae TaxID=7048 RepID=A0A6J2XF61_SITOR|nr:serine-arginine protein 55-like isoform X2 [Sitophilus oryzae]
MSSRVYVGGIPYETRERDLEGFFRGFGRIRDVLIKNGYGFVEFDDYRDAEDAVYELHGKKLLGMRVSVEMARGRPRGRDQEWFSSRDHRPRQGPPVRTQYRIFVENLSSGVSWQDLKDYLRPAGEVTFADAHKKYKNEGIVEFASYDDMKNAIRKFDDTVLNGRRIRLVEDKTTRRSRSRSRSSSADSRRRDRSRSKSASPKKEKKSHSRSRDRSRSRRSNESRHESKDRSRERSISKRKSVKRSRSVSASPEKRFKDKSASHSRSRSRSKRESRSKSRDRSRSKSPEDKKASRSRSRSRS